MPHRVIPLPSPNSKDWKHYPKHSRLPFLKSRDGYVEHVKAQRIKHLKRKIEEYKPKVVVFYGVGLKKYYGQIAGVEFQSGPRGVKIGKSKDTLFVITKHPVARGVTNDYFDRIGRMILTA